jgi:hypothetical protein
MSITDRTRKILWVKAGGRCSICRVQLVTEATEVDDPSVFGEEAHVVAQSPNGPRAGDVADVDAYDNLILLCRKHHKQIDDQVAYFTVERLRSIKREHEGWAANYGEPNMRRESLQSFDPHTFAFVITQQLVRLRLPLVLYNTGTTPIIVQNLRLRFLDEPGSLPLGWVATRSQIKPASNDGHAFPAIFPIGGGEPYQIFAEFGAPSLGFTLEARDYSVRIEIKLGHNEQWESLLTFTLRAGHIAHPDIFITYSNVPEDLSEDQRHEAEAALKQLGQQLAPKPQDT